MFSFRWGFREMPFRGSPQTLFRTIRNLLLCEVVVVEASAPKVYSRVTIANASTLSGSVVRSSRGGQGLPNMFCLVASSLAHHRCQCLLLFAKGTQWVCGGVEDIGVGVQQWSVADSQGRKEDRVRSSVSGHAILGPGEPAIHLCCPRIRRWWICKRPAYEGSRGGIGDGPRRVAGG